MLILCRLRRLVRRFCMVFVPDDDFYLFFLLRFGWIVTIVFLFFSLLELFAWMRMDLNYSAMQRLVFRFFNFLLSILIISDFDLFLRGLSYIFWGLVRGYFNWIFIWQQLMPRESSETMAIRIYRILRRFSFWMKELLILVEWRSRMQINRRMLDWNLFRLETGQLSLPEKLFWLCRQTFLIFSIVRMLEFGMIAENRGCLFFFFVEITYWWMSIIILHGTIDYLFTMILLYIYLFLGVAIMTVKVRFIEVKAFVSILMGY